MAEFLSPNYVNPDYATPEQLAQQRAYAEALIKRSGEPVNRPAGAFANMIERLTGSLERNRANEIQNQQAGMNAADMGALISQQQGGARLDPQTLGRIIANPMVGLEQRALALKLISPERISDPYGNPAYAAPATGVQGAPVNRRNPNAPFVPGVSQTLSTGDTSITNQPTPANQLMPKPVQTVPVTPQGPAQGSAFGGMKSQPLGWDQGATPIPAPQAATGGGGQPPGAGLPPASAAALEALAKKGRELYAERERVKGGAGAEAENIKGLVTQANSARQFDQDAAVMEDLIKSNPKMEFGAWARPTNEVLRVVQNITGDKLVDAKTLAASDAVEKINLSLAAAMQSRWGLNPSSITLAQGSTPGNEKSRLGTLELLGLMRQAAKRDERIATELYPIYADAGSLGKFGTAVSNFYKANPLVEPNTGHLIMDPVPVKSPADTQGMKKGTPIKLPDGRIGWVP